MKTKAERWLEQYHEADARKVAITNTRPTLYNTSGKKLAIVNDLEPAGLSLINPTHGGFTQGLPFADVIKLRDFLNEFYGDPA